MSLYDWLMKDKSLYIIMIIIILLAFVVGFFSSFYINESAGFFIYMASSVFISIAVLFIVINKNSD